ncbi:MAG: hemolysin family protein [Oscillospiraceae bacterium]
MEPDGFTGSIVIIALTLLKAFFTVCEAAVIEISDSHVKGFENGTGAEKRLFALLQKPSRLITAFAVNRIFSAILIFYAALVTFNLPLAKRFTSLAGMEGESVPPLMILLSALVIILLTVTLLTVFCDGLPKKTVNSRNAEKLALSCSLPVKLLVILLTPLTALSNCIVNLLAAMFGVKCADEDVVTEEEILMMVDAGNETGVIGESQKEMINNVFDFSDLTASDVMTHRTDIVGVEIGASVSEVVNAAISTGFSRIPVYENSIDRIVGIICVKDLLCMVGSGSAPDASAKDFIRDIDYVPETIPCGELFKQLTAKHMQMAAVADEYGGTAGIVTMEDVVESIVGNIQDEYDDESEDIIKISDDTYTIDGTASPGPVLEKLGIILPEDSGFDTMSGFVVDLLGRIPEENENPCVQYKNVLFTVLIVEDMCITKLKATILKESNNEQKEKSDDEHKEEN